jgi:hypothetical protein
MAPLICWSFSSPMLRYRPPTAAMSALIQRYCIHAIFNPQSKMGSAAPSDAAASSFCGGAQLFVSRSPDAVSPDYGLNTPSTVFGLFESSVDSAPCDPSGSVVAAAPPSGVVVSTVPPSTKSLGCRSFTDPSAAKVSVLPRAPLMKVMPLAVETSA